MSGAVDNGPAPEKPGPLFHLEDGPADADEAVVFLHGFDGRAAFWGGLRAVLSGDGRRTVAFDLPGHGRSLHRAAEARPKHAAKALVAELDRLGIRRTHLVGHSMGGAIACLMALFAPERVASLTLIAPGGFGEAIGAQPIRAVMEAESPEAIAAALAGMGAGGWSPPAALGETIARERHPEDRAAMRRLFADLFRDGRQGALPLSDVAALDLPVTLVWSVDDPVTPFPDIAGLPETFALIRLESVGHMLIFEAPRACLDAVRQSILRSEEG